MNFIFRTPRRHRLAAAACMFANIGNILATPIMKHGVFIDGTARGMLVALIHAMTIFILGFATAHLANAGGAQEAFIKMMERTGFKYDPRTREFRPDGSNKE